MFSEENKVPGALFEARKVAGSAKCKQCECKRYEIVLNLNASCLFSLRNRDREVRLFSLLMHNQISP